MPSSMTHSYFAKDVYDKLNEKTKKKINQEELKLFAQGPDCYYFYNLMIGKKAKYMRKLGLTIQTTKTKDFFINTINYIKEKNLQKETQIMTYLYGYICHYILDSTIHPFIHYKCGVFNKKDKSTYKYNGLHYEMEYFLDIYMIFQNEKKEAKDFKFSKYFPNIKFNNNLHKLINETMNLTYKIENISTAYEKGMNNLKDFFIIFNQDKTGIKKNFYKLIDKITPNNHRPKKHLSFHIEHNKKIHYLNLEKNTWNHPMYENEIYNYSFIELYHIAINKAINIINEIESILSNEKNIDDLKKLFPNISYSTGKNCDIKEKMRYFEF